MLKTELLSKIKLATTALLALTLGVACLWQATTWADGRDGNSRAKGKEAIPDGTLRVAVNEVIHDDTTVVSQVGIEALPGSTIEVFTDDKLNKSILTSGVPKQPNGTSNLQMIIFADQVELKAGSANAVKFMIGYKLGSISGSTSDTVPLPAGAKQLSDLLTVPIKSGEYKCGQAIKLVTFKGVTYTLVVNRPK